MKISGGMAEINLSRAGETGQVHGKTYIWPEYKEAPVQKITQIKPYKNDYIYYKPGLNEREELLGKMHRYEQSYNNKGKIENIPPIVSPGSFFNAIV